MKTWIRVVALVSSLAGMLGSGVAMAANGDGNELLKMCQYATRYMDNEKVNTNLFEQGRCIGIVEAVIGVTLYRNDVVPTNFKVCFPESGITTGQGVRVLVKWLKENPAILNEDNVLLTMSAFADTYPCK
jgi:hypothetical protein